MAALTPVNHERYAHYDRESRGRRVVMAVVEAALKRLRSGKPVDWERVHRHLSQADTTPNTSRRSVGEIRSAILKAVARRWHDP